MARVPSPTCEWSPAGGFAAAPTRLTLSAPAGTRSLAVPKGGGVVHFAPLRTDRLTISFPGVAARYTSAPNGARVASARWRGGAGLPGAPWTCARSPSRPER